MSDWHRMFLIAPDANRVFCNAQAAALDADGGADTFSVPLSADGSAPATHWGASSLVRPTTRTVILEQLLPALPDARVYDSPPFSWESALEDAGLQLVAPEEEL